MDSVCTERSFTEDGGIRVRIEIAGRASIPDDEEENSAAEWHNYKDKKSKANGFPTGAVFFGLCWCIQAKTRIYSAILCPSLRFCLVMYFYVHSLRKIRALRVLLVSRVLT